MARAMYSPASRKNVDTATDPYIPRKGAAAVGVCAGCRLIRRNKRWYADEAEYRALTKRGTGTVAETCPACRKIADGFVAGVLILRGDYLAIHRAEILNIVRNEEKRTRGVNPLERIVRLSEGKDFVEISTTNEKLAQRIGREVHKACGGFLEFKRSEDVKLLRVNWERNA